MPPVVVFKNKKTRNDLTSNLLEHQKRVVRYMLNHRGCLVYHGMGSGKTRIAVILVAVLKTPAIVVLPAALRENFRKEIRKIPGLSESLFNIVSSQSFLDSDIDCTGALLIVDEAHELRNADGKISQRVQQCASKAKKVLLLTGTPLVNRPSDIAPLLNMIVAGKIRIDLPGGFLGFGKRSFTEIPTGEAFQQAFGDDGLNATGKMLWTQLFPCMFSHYDPPKSPDFPTMENMEIRVPMAPEQFKFYRAWESHTLTKAMVEQLTGKSMSTMESVIQKLPQFRAYLDGGRRICNVVYDSNGQPLSPKFDRMIQILEDTNGKAIVFSQYIQKGINIAENKLQELGIKYVKFTGRETPNQKTKAVEDYNSNRVRVFLLSSAGGLGLDLHDTETIHIMEPAWNKAKILQAVYRGVRYKSHRQPDAVVKVYHYFCTKPSSLFGKQIPSTDMYLRAMSIRKDEVNRKFLDFADQHSMEMKGIGSCVIDEL